MEKPGIWEILKKTCKNLEFWTKIFKKPWIFCNFNKLSRKFWFDTKNLSCSTFFLSSSKNFFLKNTFKVALQFLFNVYILLNIVFNLKLNFKLKIDTKMLTFKNLEEIRKTWKNVWKIKWQPCHMQHCAFSFNFLKNSVLLLYCMFVAQMMDLGIKT